MKNKKKSWLYYLIAILALLFGGTGVAGTVTDNQTTVPQQTEVIVEQLQQAENQVVVEEEYVNEITYCFRNEKLLNNHYVKHGKEMGFDSPQSYEAAANAVINNPDSLHRIEEEDGDDVYYHEETNGFVIVSIDGYIRTFYYPNDGIAYFNRQ